MPDIDLKRRVNVLVLVKGVEQYHYHYDESDESHRALLQVLGRHAGDRELSFNWYDAAILSQKANKLKGK